MLEKYMRNGFSRLLTGEKKIVLRNKIPSPEVLKGKFSDIDQLGLYLHIPFCEQICPYCPYNKEIYKDDVAQEYTSAVIKEIKFYSNIVGNKPITSFYIGGGTPTTMLYSGLETMLKHIYDTFNMQCDIHLESHPNHLNSENLDTIESLGVKYLSVGVEALQDKHLNTLKRPYTSSEAKTAVNRAVNKNFNCVNVDFIFALPGQTYEEVEKSGQAFVEMGIDQVAAYPLFKFPYTQMGSNGSECAYNLPIILKRRKMLGILENIFYGADFYRSSVWAFTKQDVAKYCSVTVPLYVGLGASGGSYLKDVFYLNTFNTSEYISALRKGESPIALFVDLSQKMQMAGWIYWRIYETKFKKTDFKKRFGMDFNNNFLRYFKPLYYLGFLEDKGEEIRLSDKGSYWLHAFEDFFSIDYISTLWGTSKQDPWPEKVIL